MADMEKFYDDLIIINLYKELAKSNFFFPFFAPKYLSVFDKVQLFFPDLFHCA